MGRKRKPTNVIQLDFMGLVDVVTLKTKPYYVEQIDGTWPPYAEAIASRVIPRQPRPLVRRGERKPEFLSDKFPQHRWQKYCSGGHWEDRWKFAIDESRADKLRYYCYECENKMARKRYWAAKDATKQAA